MAAALAACEPPFEPFADFGQQRILVHAVLDPGAATQRVFIETTDGFENFLGRAAVRITTPSGREISLARPPLLRHPVEYYYRVSEHEPLQPGGTYHLRIDLPDHPAITGQTTIPAALPVLESELLPPFNPNPGASLSLAWPRVPGAKGYEVVFLYDPEFPGPFVVRNSIFADTAVELVSTARGQDGDYLFRRGTVIEITVLAADDNYVTYYRAAVDPFAGAPPSRLSGGGLGVFGSVVPVLRRRMAVLCDPRICNEPGTGSP